MTRGGNACGRAGVRLIACAVLSAPAVAGAAGFAITERSARSLGIAHAGEAAAAEDASTTYANPAGLTLIPGTQLVGSMFLIHPYLEFENQGSTLNPEVGGGPLTGGNGGDPAELAFVPTLFLSHELSSRVTLGIGLTAPFGLADQYDQGWVGRYHALSSKLVNINLSPAVGIRVNQWISVGVGVDISYVKADLTGALDLGSICQIYGAELGASPETCDAFGLVPQGVDGRIKVSVEDWGFGYGLGLLVSPTPGTRFGLGFHSRIHLDLAGDADFVIPESARVIQEASGALVNSGANASLDFPERLLVGFFQEITPDWAVMGDFTWTRWSRFETLELQFDNPKQPPIIEPENFENSFRYTLGVRWTLSPAWQLRMGTAFDDEAVSSPEFRRPRIPDADRVWIAAGVGYRPWTNVRIDFGYAHLWGLGVSSDAADAVTGHVLRGEYTGAGADIFGLQLTYDFGPEWLGASTGGS